MSVKANLYNVDIVYPSFIVYEKLLNLSLVLLSKGIKDGNLILGIFTLNRDKNLAKVISKINKIETIKYNKSPDGTQSPYLVTNYYTQDKDGKKIGTSLDQIPKITIIIIEKQHNLIIKLLCKWSKNTKIIFIIHLISTCATQCITRQRKIVKNEIWQY